MIIIKIIKMKIIISNSNNINIQVVNNQIIFSKINIILNNGIRIISQKASIISNNIKTLIIIINKIIIFMNNHRSLIQSNRNITNNQEWH